MKAKKHLGQHFLKSTKALSDIIAAAELTPTDTVLEIGPGHGVLTQELLTHSAKVIAVEKDRELIPLLKEKFTTPNLTIIEQDVLDFDPHIVGTSYKLIANIPYYITGAIIEQFLSTQHQPQRMVLLIQREVAERIVARDGKESILSLAVRAYGTPKLIARVPRGAFVPPPSVESAVLAITGISRVFFEDCDERLFFEVLKTLFGKKRKQIGGSLADYLQNKERALAILAQVGIDPKTRPEDMHLDIWKSLVNEIARVQ